MPANKSMNSTNKRINVYVREKWHPKIVPPHAHTYLVHLMATEEHSHLEMIRLCFENTGFRLTALQFERFARVYWKEVVSMRALILDMITPTPDVLIERADNLIHKLLHRTTTDYKIYQGLSHQFSNGLIDEKTYSKAIKPLYLMPVADLLRIRNKLKDPEPPKPRGRPKNEAAPVVPESDINASTLSEADQKLLDEALARGDTIEMQRILHAATSSRKTTTKS